MLAGTVELPIFEKLVNGVRFDLRTLLDSYDDTQRFWDWWWEQADVGRISRPETIDSSSDILQSTSEKDTVDLVQDEEFFDDFLYQALLAGRIERGPRVGRQSFRDQLVRIVASNSTKLQGRPQVVFSGGGYGSGKTTIVAWLAKSGKLPLSASHMVGVDYFKFYVPEFSLMQEAADGRASLTVQRECVGMANRLFDQLVAQERSFVWDSSMSDEGETMKRIQVCRDKGYGMRMVGVLTPLPVAIRQAMLRARDSRRFPHPEFLPKSHVEFRRAFSKYVHVFEDILVFGNCGTNPDEHPIIAEKCQGKDLAIHDQEAFNKLITVTDS